MEKDWGEGGIRNLEKGNNWMGIGRQELHAGPFWALERAREYIKLLGLEVEFVVANAFRLQISPLLALLDLARLKKLCRRQGSPQSPITTPWSRTAPKARVRGRRTNGEDFLRGVESPFDRRVSSNPADR